MSDNNINGLEIEEIEQALHSLIGMHQTMGEIPSGKNGVLGDVLYTELEAKIPVMANMLTMAPTLEKARDDMFAFLEDLILGEALQIEPNINQEKIYRYIDNFAGEIENVLVDLGFNAAAIED